ncbi:pyridoxal phosphate-dependent aminotransferase [Alphaproteobacteria bacterium GH1-50]|uniref:histidinol-phosphate transaminase n=1 Tax=Kangsaoukella pontilimi TaxID=2691042 RepID=A0A7C9MCZ5_9RHOB|nr:pyridoxal phosphate-dependent aminotransferase [Kangsaoukella pontilimi]MXQ07911.1 pyridoxal phosphate-dependent aminotransferase [Kangsaoukella pontilimi]
MSGAKLTKIAEALPSTVPFVGPEAAERQRGTAFTARLGANESVYGPSPKVLRAIEAAAPDVWMYGDPESHDLRRALALHHGVEMSEIVCGAGIDGLLNSIVRLHVEPGVSVVTSDGAYPTFNYHVAGYGGTLTKVPFRDDHEDPEALLRAATETGARLIYLSNPDNPMGSHHPAQVIDDMIADLPDGCLLVLDEAYIELAPDGTAPLIDTSNPQVIRMRTFSKAYGMAGMRIGYAIGEAGVIRSFEKVRNHFGIGRLSQQAALAALADTEWLEIVRAEVARARDRIAGIARENGLTPLPSATNFVTIDCGRGAEFAKTVLDALVARGIFIRMPFAEPGNRCIRVSCGTDQDLDRFAAALPPALAEAGSAMNDG